MQPFNSALVSTRLASPNCSVVLWSATCQNGDKMLRECISVRPVSANKHCTLHSALFTYTDLDPLLRSLQLSRGYVGLPHISKNTGTVAGHACPGGLLLFSGLREREREREREKEREGGRERKRERCNLKCIHCGSLPLTERSTSPETSASKMTFSPVIIHRNASPIGSWWMPPPPQSSFS
ncbi:hypothetical protein GOODEAATRI_031912 [Goodea atripinnis]|uniref:Uncharacterized protein n=1 Tax=Goodea atripinnis TaxID=208336 RepID=A0ABV0NZD5_9TELE